MRGISSIGGLAGGVLLYLNVWAWCVRCGQAIEWATVGVFAWIAAYSAADCSSGPL